MGSASAECRVRLLPSEEGGSPRRQMKHRRVMAVMYTLAFLAVALQVVYILKHNTLPGYQTQVELAESDDDTSSTEADDTEGTKDVPLILAWTPFFRWPIEKQFERMGMLECSHQCRISTNKSLYNESSAVLFHARDFLPKELPPFDESKQFIFLSLESPAEMFQGGKYFLYKFFSKPVPKVFTSSMTYRKDSEYWMPYDTINKITEDTPADAKYSREQVEAAVALKSKGVLTLISHCGTPSKREKVIGEIAKLQNVDITLNGKCWNSFYSSWGHPSSVTNGNCTRAKPECEEDAIKSHHFVVALENNLCKDYITEKFFRFKKLIVPIVQQRKYYQDVPQDIFIAVDDFPSVAAFNDHLIYLMHNHTAYSEYFQWTETYESNMAGGPGYCELCKDLHEKKEEKYTQKDVVTWFRKCDIDNNGPLL